VISLQSIRQAIENAEKNTQIQSGAASMVTMNGENVIIGQEITHEGIRNGAIALQY
jgi:hypothetical protein